AQDGALPDFRERQLVAPGRAPPAVPLAQTRLLFAWTEHRAEGSGQKKGRRERTPVPWFPVRSGYSFSNRQPTAARGPGVLPAPSSPPAAFSFFFRGWCSS